MAVLIERTRGDTFTDEIVVTSEITGQAIDITGYSFIMTLDPAKAPIDNANNLYSLTGNIIDAPNGLVGFAPTAMQANQIGSFFYDVQMTDANGKVRTIALGKYKYTQDITK